MDKDTTHLIIKAVAAIVCAAIIAFGLLRQPRRYESVYSGKGILDTWTGMVYHTSANQVIFDPKKAKR